jgi:hypothetical protein
MQVPAGSGPASLVRRSLAGVWDRSLGPVQLSFASFHCAGGQKRENPTGCAGHLHIATAKTDKARLSPHALRGMSKSAKQIFQIRGIPRIWKNGARTLGAIFEEFLENGGSRQI